MSDVAMLHIDQSDPLAKLRMLRSRLNRLEEELPAFPIVLSAIQNGSRPSPRVVYEMEEGECYAHDLLTIPGLISCADWFNSGGAKFKEHAHVEKEFFVLYEGRMDLKCDNKLVVLSAGESYYIRPRTIHSASFSADTRYISITIPDSPSWPGNIKMT